MSAWGRVSRGSPVQTAMRNCTRDEGRSFEAGSQVLASNRCKLLSSKAMVVSVAVNVGRISRRVRLREASASEPPMNCRKRIRRCQNRGVTLPPGSARGNPEACPSGIRHVGGAKLNQARKKLTCSGHAANSRRYRDLGSTCLCRGREWLDLHGVAKVGQADDGPWRQSGVLKEPRSNLYGAYSHQANERPRCRRRAASLTSLHSLRVGNAGGRLVRNVRTWPAMPREKMLWGGGENLAFIGADLNRWSRPCKSGTI